MSQVVVSLECLATECIARDIPGTDVRPSPWIYRTTCSRNPPCRLSWGAAWNNTWGPTPPPTERHSLRPDAELPARFDSVPLLIRLRHLLDECLEHLLAVPSQDPPQPLRGHPRSGATIQALCAYKHFNIA